METVLAVGTWQVWSRFWGTRRAPLKTFVDILLEAFSLGVRVVDTAAIYGLGRAEAVVGLAVRRFGDEVAVVTKVPGFAACDADRWVAASARRLGRAPDVVLVHWPGNEACVARALDEVVARGLARCVGLSNHSPARVLGILERLRRADVEVLQFELSLVRPGGLELVRLARALGAHAMAWSPLARGLLGGARPGLRRLLGDWVWLDRRARRVAAIVEALARVAGTSPARLAVEWVVHVGALPIVGARSRGRFAQLLSAPPAPEWALAALDRLVEPSRYSEPWFAKLPGAAQRLLTLIAI